MSSPSFSTTEFVIRTIAETACDNEIYFGQLDSVVGDGDFGYSLARGFEVILADWDNFDRSDIGTFLQKIAVAITSRIGGTSGPIWGSALLRAAAQLNGREDLTGQDAVAALRAAIEGIKKRGGADLGDKTLIDALVPVADSLEASFAQGKDAGAALEIAAGVAEEAAEATTKMQAMRGRAAYTGERSIGSPDPGAVAVAVMLRRISTEWGNR